MHNGKEIWEAATTGTKTGDSKSAHVMRTYALAQMLAAAEAAVLTGKNQHAAEALCDLQAHTEKFVGFACSREEIPTHPRRCLTGME